MQIIITDSSGLIDLKKGSLFRAMLALPYEFVIPDLLFEDELLSLEARDKELLLYGGLRVESLSGEQIIRAQEYRSLHRRLSLHDNFALVLAEDTETSILLTGDSTLKTLAAERNIEVHGVLWVLDLIFEHKTAPTKVLIDAVGNYLEDPFVWLPDAQLRKRLVQYQDK
ncbi:MAG: hypothetical protein COA91_10200 [Robiginitomaculum sp.]|nr:MAG: hypothetical protein COA91_10200 [Robiginitomaculum sp.]